MAAMAWRKLPDRAGSSEGPGEERRHRNLGDLVFPGAQPGGKVRERKREMESKQSQCVRGVGGLGTFSFWAGAWGAFSFWAGFQPLPFPEFIQ